jgi:hypothetical protein
MVSVATRGGSSIESVSGRAGFLARWVRDLGVRGATTNAANALAQRRAYEATVARLEQAVARRGGFDTVRPA